MARKKPSRPFLSKARVHAVLTDVEELAETANTDGEAYGMERAVEHLRAELGILPADDEGDES